MASKEDQALFRSAEKWLTENPGKTLRDWRKATGYTGPALKPRNRKGEPIRVSFKGASTTAQQERAIKEKPKTEEEAAYVRSVKAQAKQQSQSTEAQFVSGGKPSIAEHDVRLASGGTNEYMSVSDPEFKEHKDKLEAAVQRQFGDDVVVDIDDVSGETRVIPKRVHNKFQPTSQQPGVDIPQGMDIQAGLDQIRQLLNRKRPINRFSTGRTLVPMEAPSQERFGPGGMMSTIDLPHERQGIWQR